MLFNKFTFLGERASLRDIEGINLARYKFALKYCKRKSVLELGCGSGYGANYLAKNGAGEVFAYDASSRSIEFANKTFKLPNIKFICKRIEEVNEKRVYDAVINFEVIEHLQNTEKLLKLVNKSLKKGGLLVVSTPNRLFSSYDGNKPTNPYHVREYFDNEFRSLLKKHFKQIILYGIFLRNEKKDKEISVKNSYRWKVSNYLSHKRWIRRVLNYLPEYPKRLFTGEIKMDYSKEDYIFKRFHPERAEYFIAICK